MKNGNKFIVSPALDPEEVIFGPVKTSREVFANFSNRAQPGNTLWYLNARTGEADEIGHWKRDARTKGVVYVEV